MGEVRSIIRTSHTVGNNQTRFYAPKSLLRFRSSDIQSSIHMNQGYFEFNLVGNYLEHLRRKLVAEISVLPVKFLNVISREIMKSQIGST